MAAAKKVAKGKRPRKRASSPAKQPRRSGRKASARLGQESVGAVAVGSGANPGRAAGALAARMIDAIGGGRRSATRGPNKGELRKVLRNLRLGQAGRHHKRRASLFYSRVSWPLRDRSARALLAARQQATRMPHANVPANRKWVSAGPTNIGGRATAIVCDAQAPDRILLGTGGGGVWRSDDAGRTWKPTMTTQEHNIGALALDPKNSKVVYCATGEANLSADSYAGVGLYKSTNFGTTWRLVASSERTGIPTRIGTIAVDPFDSRRVLLGGVSHDYYFDATESSGGLFRSVNSGTTWKRLDFISTNNYWCHSIEFHPVRRGWVFATVTENGVRNGFWMSRNGGDTWTQAMNGLPDPDRFGRARIAIAPSRPDRIYLVAARANTDALLGIYRSDNAGQSWTSVTSNFGEESQMSYGIVLAVHPTNPNHVLCGGVDLHLTTDAGANWHVVTNWDGLRGDPWYAHADHHAVLMPAAAPGRVYDANDGGLDVSEDGGFNWANRSNGLACTMFYDLEVAGSDPEIYGGGAQDNGTVVTEGAGPDGFEEWTGGDGGWIVIDPNNPEYRFTSCQFITITRYRNGSWTDWQSPMPYGMPAAERDQVWMAYVVMDPSDSRIVYVGSNRLWRTLDSGDTWQPVSPNFDDSPITVIEPSGADQNVIYIGTENGGIFRTRDFGANWTDNLAGADVPGYTITRLESNPDNPEQVYASIANFGVSHVFRSDNYGTSWIDVDRGRLPDVPHRSIVVTPDDVNRVFVANDVGVFMSTNAGGRWTSLTRNLPAVAVVDIVYHAASRTLFAATYGRSIWRLQL